MMRKLRRRPGSGNGKTYYVTTQIERRYDVKAGCSRMFLSVFSTAEEALEWAETLGGGCEAIEVTVKEDPPGSWPKVIPQSWFKVREVKDGGPE